MRDATKRAEDLTQVVLASGNAGKLREIKAILAPYRFDVRGQHEFGVEDAEETGQTFVENALIKARHACHETGLPAIADDSGLVVDALGGAPGITSARYAGAGADDDANVKKLLAALSGAADKDRCARFVCAMVWLAGPNDAWPKVGLGEWPGRIGTAPRGTHGFGYDPVFMPDGHDMTSAQLPSEEKNRISHRARALSALIKQLPAAR